MRKESVKRSDPGNPIIIAQSNSQARITLRKSIAKLTDNPEDISFFKNIQLGFEELKSIISSGIEIDLFATDTFVENSFNIFTFIKEMEADPRYWNVPLLVYTHAPDIEMFNKIRKDIVHLPFRILPITLDEEQVMDVIKGLLEYKDENRYYIELEAKVLAVAGSGDRSSLSKTTDLIDKHASKYGKVLHPAKVALLKGRLYYELWKSGGKKNEELLKDAENAFLEAHEGFPRHWETIFSLYTLYMEQNMIKKAKEYLTTLIEIFPEHAKFSYRMGKLNELEGDFSSAVKQYLTAAQAMIEEGVSGFNMNDVMEIVDASLDASKKMLADMNLTSYTERKTGVGSIEYMLVRTLKQNNATARTVLIQLTKKVSDDPDLFNKIGITYRRTGSYDMAMEMYGKALKLAPDNQRIRLNYSVALAMSGLWDVAGKEMAMVKRDNSEADDAAVIEMLVDVIDKKDAATLEKIVI